MSLTGSKDVQEGIIKIKNGILDFAEKYNHLVSDGEIADSDENNSSSFLQRKVTKTKKLFRTRDDKSDSDSENEETPGKSLNFFSTTNIQFFSKSMNDINPLHVTRKTQLQLYIFYFPVLYREI